MADTPMYPTPQAPNPLGQVGQLVGLERGVMQNKLLRGNLAMGKNYQQATGPNGQIDTNKLISMTAQNPQTAFMTNQVATTSFARDIEHANAQMANIERGLKMNAAGAQYIGAAAADPTPENVKSQIVKAHQAGVLNTASAASLIADIPQDPSKLPAWIKEHQLMALNNGQQLAAVYGQPMVQDTGNKLVIGRYSPVVGGFTPQEILPKKLSPSQLATPIKIWDGQKQQFQEVPLGQFLKLSGHPEFSGSGGSVGGTAPPSAGEAGAANTEGSGYVAGSPRLGEPEAAAATGAASGKNLAVLEQDVGNAQGGAVTRITNLQLALSALPGAQTGGGAHIPQEIRNHIMGLVPQWVSKSIGMDPQKVASYQELHKYLTRAAMYQAGSIGAGTDQQLATAIAGTPNISMNKLALKDLIHVQIGLERYKVAELRAWQQAKASGQVQDMDFNDWSSRWTSSTDPRVFLLPYMSKDALERLSPAARTRIFTDAQRLMSEGLIAGKPSAQGGSGG